MRDNLIPDLEAAVHWKFIRALFAKRRNECEEKSTCDRCFRQDVHSGATQHSFLPDAVSQRPRKSVSKIDHPLIEKYLAA